MYEYFLYKCTMPDIYNLYPTLLIQIHPIWYVEEIFPQNEYLLFFENNYPIRILNFAIFAIEKFRKFTHAKLNTLVKNNC